MHFLRYDRKFILQTNAFYSPMFQIKVQLFKMFI